MTNSLSALEGIHVSVILEDCIDQLAILGRIMPNSNEDNKDETNEIVALIEEQKTLEARYEELMSSRETSSENDIKDVTQQIKLNTQAINKSFRKNKFVEDSGQKVQQDRQFLNDVLESTLNEIKTNRTFNVLIESVASEKSKKTELLAIVAREEESRKRVKQLQRSIVENRKEHETELQKRNELIAHLKDELQETKAKTTMESRYIKKDADVRVSCSQKKCNMTEQELKEEILQLNQQIENESRCNQEIETFLKAHHTLLEEKVEYWMDKYDSDVEQKQNELDTLKSTKASDLARLQELTQKFHDFSKVVEEDRVEKERLRREAEQELEEKNACVKLQSWWKGVMVRKQLGPYRPKKKGKKGKKSGKAKKGGKKK